MEEVRRKNIFPGKSVPLCYREKNWQEEKKILPGKSVPLCYREKNLIILPELLFCSSYRIKIVVVWMSNLVLLCFGCSSCIDYLPNFRFCEAWLFHFSVKVECLGHWENAPGSLCALDRPPLPARRAYLGRSGGCWTWGGSEVSTGNNLFPCLCKIFPVFSVWAPGLLIILEVYTEKIFLGRKKKLLRGKEKGKCKRKIESFDLGSSKY